MFPPHKADNEAAFRPAPEVNNNDNVPAAAAPLALVARSSRLQPEGPSVILVPFVGIPWKSGIFDCCQHPINARTGDTLWESCNQPHPTPTSNLRPHGMPIPLLRHPPMQLPIPPLPDSLPTDLPQTRDAASDNHEKTSTSPPPSPKPTIPPPPLPSHVDPEPSAPLPPTTLHHPDDIESMQAVSFPPAPPVAVATAPGKEIVPYVSHENYSNKKRNGPTWAWV
ncbi:hypothetical protein NL676_035434 [Syzygium grande]|nr:hypothetical protein NL676_035434 [Syzygium grande]